MSGNKELSDHTELVKERIEQQVKKPPMYNVVLLNDDYTPMDFVVDVLCKFFNMNSDQATDVMLTIHYEGKGKCGTYTAEVAEMKVNQVSRYAKSHQHPLRCSMEQA
ncbi:ATP-dependent Clp protease adapter ClpS [Thalassotalea agarivorans]|uniref:ATP-dependent Clp protease adapter protein ClpS n=1 Tax=Thalassotalea agarivorans TaxID=349064 RepID=A0A1I0DA32_THASX|nr:ATP-dependent Clp protease adapter ClpS [Thalassotalea agarivorans]SET29071.1 ATP-dependent Clp protease adaptor protein ClpS [Thalassotalea agarivorans]